MIKATFIFTIIRSSFGDFTWSNQESCTYIWVDGMSNSNIYLMTNHQRDEWWSVMCHCHCKCCYPAVFCLGWQLAVSQCCAGAETGHCRHWPWPSPCQLCHLPVFAISRVARVGLATLPPLLPALPPVTQVSQVSPVSPLTPLPPLPPLLPSLATLPPACHHVLQHSDQWPP